VKVLKSHLDVAEGQRRLNPRGGLGARLPAGLLDEPPAFQGAGNIFSKVLQSDFIYGDFI